MMKKSLRAKFRVAVGTLAALLVAAVCARLGIWQLDRLEERRVRNDAIEARMTQPAYSLTGALEDTTGMVYRIVEAVGEFDAATGVVIAGRSYQSTPGAHLLVPLRLADGTAVLVHRGWLPALDAGTIDPAAHTPAGTVSVRGLLMAFPETGKATAVTADDLTEVGSASEFRRLWYLMDGERWRLQSPYPLAGYYLQELPDDAATGYPVALPAPELDDGPHLGYAIQWFAFGTIALVGWGILIFRRPVRSASPRMNRG